MKNVFSLFFLVLFINSCQEIETDNRPNIIFILADDLGYNELGCYGQTKIETPNIDALAENGIKFNQHYSGSPVCAPSRCIFLTGQHSGNAYVRGNDEWNSRGDVWDFEKVVNDPNLEGQYPMPSDSVTIAELLKEKGYSTGMVGKWGLGAPLSEGIPIVCHADPKDVTTIASGIQKYSGTILVGTPTFLRMFTISKKVSSESMQSLRLVVAGAEKLRSEVRDGFEAKFKISVYEGYGTTETSPGASVNLPDIESPYKLRNRPGTVGKAFSGTEFKIVDPDSIEPLPTGEDGLILIGGPQIMKGYLKMPEKTAEVIELIDGYRWYRTGDKGHLDEDGFLTIVDRYSRFAKIGGEMISLTTVEEEILDACNEKDLEIAATCLPDQRKGEKIVLLANKNLDKNQLKRLLSDAKVNPLYHPAQVLIVEEIPKLGSGKTDFGATKKIALVNEQK